MLPALFRTPMDTWNGVSVESVVVVPGSPQLQRRLADRDRPLRLGKARGRRGQRDRAPCTLDAVD